MKNILAIILILFSTNAMAQCAGVQSFTLDPQPVNGNYEPGTVVTMCYTMTGWNGTSFGSNWLEGFSINLGPGWASATPVQEPGNCSADGTWLWVQSSTSASTGTTVGPGYFYEGPQGPVDGDPGNDWGDFGTTCVWTFCMQLQVIDECNPLSLLIEVTPYGDGTMGSWGNESCFDGPFQVFNGLVTGGTVNTSVISPGLDTTCFGQIHDYSVVNTPGSTYNWQISGGGTISSNNGNSIQVLWGNTPGSYTVSVQETTADGCLGDVMYSDIEVVEPLLNLGTPYSVCPGTSINLFASPSDGVWSSLNVDDGVFVSEYPGEFYPEYTANVYGCTVRDSVLVLVSQPPAAPILTYTADNLDLCYASYLQYYLAPDQEGVIYTWRVDGELQSDQDFELQMFWPDSTTDHSITVYGTDSVGCVGEKSYLTVHTDACLRLYIPISFTPNGDGFNDAFKIVGESIYNPKLKIFSRDGQVIHETNRIDQAWNGNDGNGYYCPNGVYNWILNYQDDRGFGHQEAGHVVLIR